MSKSVKWILVALLLAAFIVGMYFLYNYLVDEYAPDNLKGNAGGESESGEEKDYSPAPDFTVLDEKGNRVSLSDFRGKPVVLNFWATWCYYCKAEMPDFNTAYQKYPDVQFLMVNATDGVEETVDKAKKYVEENGFLFDIFFDTESEAVSAYNVTGFPCTFFIDENGYLIAWGQGMLDLESVEKGIGMITEKK